MDFRKAFDCIDHEKLWNSLERKGIGGKFLRIFKTMYGQLNCKIKINDILLNPFQCKRCTRQGCGSSPVIFDVFINDLVEYLRLECNRGVFVSNDIEDILALLFANDVSCFADTVFNLPKQLDSIHKFCKSFRMCLNLDKTKIVVFRKGGVLKKSEKWFYDGKEIETVSLQKYLGALITSRLCWSSLKNNQAAQAKKACYSIYRSKRKFGYFSPSDYF